MGARPRRPVTTRRLVWSVSRCSRTSTTRLCRTIRWTTRQRWGKRRRVPGYAMDDETAIKVAGGTVEVISEGTWQLFAPGAPSETN
jgi:hypothetical protein